MWHMPQKCFSRLECFRCDKLVFDNYLIPLTISPDMHQTFISSLIIFISTTIYHNSWSLTHLSPS